MVKDLATRVFFIHLAVYAAAVVICAAVNLWLTPDKLWFIWVLFGWGIGVAAHGLALLLRKTHRPERIFVDPKARAFTVHLFAYVAVIILLFVVNLTVTPQKWWFYWVALGWGAGIAANAWAVFGRSRPKGSGSAARQADTPKPKAPGAKTQSTPRKKSATPRKRSKPKA